MLGHPNIHHFYTYFAVYMAVKNLRRILCRTQEKYLCKFLMVFHKTLSNGKPLHF